MYRHSPPFQVDGANFAQHLNKRVAPTNFECLRPALDAVHAKCFNIAQEDYALEAAFSLVSLCEAGHTATSIVAAIERTCPETVFLPPILL